MPELPEVETIVERLRVVLVGKVVGGIEVFKSKSFIGDVDEILGQQVSDISRRAKLISIRFSGGLSVLVHLKMTGQLIYLDGQTRLGGGHPTADWVQDLPSKHTRVVFTFQDKSKLFFNDMRIFGWMKLMDEDGVKAEFARFGPDVIDESVTPALLYPALQRRKIAIKQAILDSKLVAGVGNIYACDALNLAQIHPQRESRTLSLVELTRLIEAMQSVINKGIKLGGATIDNYRDVSGFSGGYQDVVLVYGREGEECYNCKEKIKKIKLGGRGTYFCEGCQG